LPAGLAAGRRGSGGGRPTAAAPAKEWSVAALLPACAAPGLAAGQRTLGPRLGPGTGLAAGAAGAGTVSPRRQRGGSGLGRSHRRRRPGGAAGRPLGQDQASARAETGPRPRAQAAPRARDRLPRPTAAAPAGGEAPAAATAGGRGCRPVRFPGPLARAVAEVGAGAGDVTGAPGSGRLAPPPGVAACRDAGRGGGAGAGAGAHGAVAAEW